MFRPRITAQQLMTYYGTPERALAAGDFFTALRLSDGDPELVGICRVMLGNEVAGTALLDNLADPTPRARLVSAIGHWLLGDDAGELPPGPAAGVLRAAMAICRPRVAFFSGTEAMDRFVAAVRASGHAELVTIGHRPDRDVPITPATDPAALVAAVGDVDALYIDNLTVLPPQLAAIRAPKICHFYDLEHFYAARGRELDWIDWPIAVASGWHLEAGMRYGLPGLIRGLGLTDMWPDRAGVQGLMQETATARPIDVLFTGGIDMPFYPDKKSRLARLAQIPAASRIEIYGKMLDRADYFARLGQAKFVFSSIRTPNCAPQRLIESIAHGALVLCEQDSSIDLIFATDLPVFHHYAPDRIARDVAGHLDRYPSYRDRIATDPHGVAALIAQIPSTERATLGFARYVTLLAQMTQAGLTWPGLLSACEAGSFPQPSSRAANGGVAIQGNRTKDNAPASGLPRRSAPRNDGKGDPAVAYAAKHYPMQAYQPALRRALYAPLAAADITCSEQLVAIASLAICDRPDHLLRRQALGRKKAAAQLMAVLNRARREAPSSLLVWLHIAELLLDLNRLAATARVLAAIEAAWPSLTLDDRPALVTPGYEFDDYGFVDSLIAEHLSLHRPDVFGPPQDRPRTRLRARIAWLRARLARTRGDMAALGAAVDEMIQAGRSDAWLLEQAMLLATAGLRSPDARQFVARLCLAFVCGSRLCPRFLYLHFPNALQAMAILDRAGLARIMIARFLRAKIRIRLAGAEIVVTDAERQMLDSFGPAFAEAIARMPGGMQAMLQP